MSKIMVFGEIIWDVFANESKIGGAPFNLSAHMAGLNADVYMVSALGDDELGRKARENLDLWKVNGKYVSCVKEPTGYCLVTLDENAHPSYDLVENTAYDNIPITSVQESFDALCFGSLAIREYNSYRSLKELLKKEYKTVFYDVNVRMPYFYKGLAEELMEYTTILKLSREEACYLEMGEDIDEIANNILVKYPNINQVLMTLDKDGAAVYDRDEGKLVSQMPKSKPVSTVGAGDSFSACYLVNYLNGQSNKVCLERAVNMSDYVITQLGAVMELPSELKSKLI